MTGCKFCGTLHGTSSLWCSGICMIKSMTPPAGTVVGVFGEPVATFDMRFLGLMYQTHQADRVTPPPQAIDVHGA